MNMMRPEFPAIFLTIAGAVIPFVPANAASLTSTGYNGRDDSGARMSHFAGARVRLALGGKATQPRLKAGLALTMMQAGTSNDGMLTYRYGEGLAFGFIGGQPAAHLSVGGYSLTHERLNAPDGQHLGLSTLGIAGVAVGGLLAAVGIGYLALLNSAKNCSPDCS